jgi:hypothetical protein
MTADWKLGSLSPCRVDHEVRRKAAKILALLLAYVPYLYRLHPVVCYNVGFLAVNTSFFKQNQSNIPVLTLVLFLGLLHFSIIIR